MATRFRVSLILVFVGLGFWITLIARHQAHFPATLLVLDLMAAPSDSLLHTITEPSPGTTVTISTTVGAIETQYYPPTGEGPHGALILVVGYPSNIEDPQLNRLADSLARLGVATLVPRLPGLRNGELTEDDVDVLVDAFQWLAARTEIAPDHIGFGGFCVGSSLALLAAQDPRINEDVALVNVFGGYYDLQTFLRATAVHSARYQGEEYAWQPSEQTVALFAQNVFGYLDNADDKTILRQYFADEMADIEQLTPAGRVALGLLTSTNAQEVDTLIAQMPLPYRTQITKVSPSAGIERLQAKVFIMHDVNDPYVPVVESYRLADAISNPDQKVQADFVLFNHVRPDTALDKVTAVREGIRLILYLGPLLRELEPAR